MAILAGSVSGVWPTITGVGMAWDIWLQILPTIQDDINSIIKVEEGAPVPDLAAQDASAQKWVALSNALATSISSHLVTNTETVEAATQLVYLKEQLAATQAKLSDLAAKVQEIAEDQNTMSTEMIASEAEQSALNFNLETIRTAADTLNQGMAAGPPTSTLALGVYVTLMEHPVTNVYNGTGVLSIATCKDNHMARSLTFFTDLAAAQLIRTGELATLKGLIDALPAELETVTQPTSDSIV